MSATDTVKELIRIANTAGLSKDVIDLMEKKLALLTAELVQANMRISQFEIENRQLKTQIQNSKPVAGALQESMGVFWKQTSKGFEPNPYCAECSHHPIMMEMPPFRPMFWQCSQGHTAPLSVNPPDA